MSKGKASAGGAGRRFIFARTGPAWKDRGNVVVRLRSGDEFIVRPWEHTMIEDAWLDDGELQRLVEEGVVEIVRSDKPMKNPDRNPNPVLVDGMSPAMVQTIKLICSTPYSQQYEKVINLHHHLSPETGMPKPGTLVTSDYLKRVHSRFLKAIVDLESRWQNRPGVISACTQALDAISRL